MDVILKVSQRTQWRLSGRFHNGLGGGYPEGFIEDSVDVILKVSYRTQWM